MIPGDLLSAFPHRQFHTLPGLLDSWAALPNSNPNACVPMQGGSLYHFYDGLWYDPAERRNSRPTVREADTLPTEPTRHGRSKERRCTVITCSQNVHTVGRVLVSEYDVLFIFQVFIRLCIHCMKWTKGTNKI